MNEMMVVTGETGTLFAEKCSGDDHRDVRALLTDWRAAMANHQRVRCRSSKLPGLHRSGAASIALRSLVERI